MLGIKAKEILCALLLPFAFVLVIFAVPVIYFREKMTKEAQGR